MTKEQKQAIETLNKIKDIYNKDSGDLLSGNLWSEFMELCNEQIEILSSDKND